MAFDEQQKLDGDRKTDEFMIIGMVKCEPRNFRPIRVKNACFPNQAKYFPVSERRTSQQRLNEVKSHPCIEWRDLESQQEQKLQQHFQKREPKQYFQKRKPQGNLKRQESYQRLKMHEPDNCTRKQKSKQCFSRQKLCSCSLCHGKDVKDNDEVEVCVTCNERVTYQSFKVCGCGYRPATVFEPLPSFKPRLTACGDASFIRTAGVTIVEKDLPRSLFYCVQKK
ncbi:hypothetical protein NPIL_406121 [Nephila pilipes]|uniref:Uncharacterized protein n=1 Tax=Nephila pilipes TaxID=299642 RepID=A0A8X6QYP3_NEPPI|nr:hypothetical protein NPIL_406121 [Nephila pilipes]